MFSIRKNTSNKYQITLMVSSPVTGVYLTELFDQQINFQKNDDQSITIDLDCVPNVIFLAMVDGRILHSIRNESSKSFDPENLGSFAKLVERQDLSLEKIYDTKMMLDS